MIYSIKVTLYQAFYVLKSFSKIKLNIKNMTHIMKLIAKNIYLGDFLNEVGR